MANEALQKIAEKLPEMRAQLEQVKDTIDFMRETEQDVTSQEAEYNKLLRLIGKWEAALTRRNIKVPPRPPV